MLHLPLVGRAIGSWKMNSRSEKEWFFVMHDCLIVGSLNLTYVQMIFIYLVMKVWQGNSQQSLYTDISSSIGMRVMFRTWTISAMFGWGLSCDWLMKGFWIFGRKCHSCVFGTEHNEHLFFTRESNSIEVTVEYCWIFHVFRLKETREQKHGEKNMNQQLPPSFNLFHWRI